MKRRTSWNAMKRGDVVRRRRQSYERGRILQVEKDGLGRAALVLWSGPSGEYDQWCMTFDLRRAPKPGDRNFDIS